MSDPLLIMPLMLWLFTYGVSSILRRILAKKLGYNSEFYADYRQQNFVINLLNSVVSAGLILFIMNRPIPPQYTNFIAVPYFGIIAYCITSAFRVLKEARSR
ncbi:MAG: hypothetical protein AAGU75_24615 [Bacillota bacterium]